MLTRSALTAPNSKSLELAPRASLSPTKDALSVEWPDGQVSQYAAVWLRDNCPHPSVTDPSSFGRLLLLSDLDTEIAVEKIETSPTGVVAVWPDGHISNYSYQWLRHRVLEETEIEKIMWGQEHMIARHQYREVIREDMAMLDLLEDLVKYGITIVENTPSNTESLKILLKKVGHVRFTHYGWFWNVKTKSNPLHVAYTSATLGLHLDQPWYAYTPGVQLLHCIKQYQGEGARNEFVDAFTVAETMREKFHAEFDLLCRTEVHFWDGGVLDNDDAGLSGKFHKRHSRPTFLLDQHGKLKQVSFSNHSRSSQLFGDVELTKDLYRALKLFYTLCYQEEFLVKYKLKEGDIAVFDNHRVMHGREGFTVKDGEEGDRHLLGSYIDWDEINDKINVLKNKTFI